MEVAEPGGPAVPDRLALPIEDGHLRERGPSRPPRHGAVTCHRDVGARHVSHRLRRDAVHHQLGLPLQGAVCAVQLLGVQVVIADEEQAAASSGRVVRGRRVPQQQDGVDAGSWPYPERGQVHASTPAGVRGNKRETGNPRCRARTPGSCSGRPPCRIPRPALAAPPDAGTAIKPTRGRCQSGSSRCGSSSSGGSLPGEPASASSRDGLRNAVRESRLLISCWHPVCGIHRGRIRGPERRPPRGDPEPGSRWASRRIARRAAHVVSAAAAAVRLLHTPPARPSGESAGADCRSTDHWRAASPKAGGSSPSCSAARHAGRQGRASRMKRYRAQERGESRDDPPVCVPPRESAWGGGPLGGGRFKRTFQRQAHVADVSDALSGIFFCSAPPAGRCGQACGVVGRKARSSRTSDLSDAGHD